MDSSSLHTGCPCGGCSILYRKMSSITPLPASSDHFCAIKFKDSSGLLFLMVSIYMSAESTLSFTDYLNTLGELEGFVNSHNCDGMFLIGDFNVDFDCSRMYNTLLSDFMTEWPWDLVACDLPFRSSIMYTHERDNGVLSLLG